jgi:hypothetical protein
MVKGSRVSFACCGGEKPRIITVVLAETGFNQENNE